ncbi:MAG: shikimate dehydrogenase [Bacteroidota bacterium]
MPELGLIGYPLSHSFSPDYFKAKFIVEELNDWTYHLFPLKDIETLTDLLVKHTALQGLNITIPYKTAVIPFCSSLTDEAREIGAVNCIEIIKTPDGKELKGHNTDVEGFRKSLLNWYQPTLRNALIIGNGGAAKAVEYVLKNEGISITRVARTTNENRQIDYIDLPELSLAAFDLIINCTPVGMYPDAEQKLPIQYSDIRPHHHYYDLVYNPDVTATMQTVIDNGGRAKNGLEMLHLQADAAWNIWRKK